MGRSESGDLFRLALLGRTPFGRAKVKLEWEVEPLGTAFDGSGTKQSATWLDTGTAGVQISQLVDDLSMDTAYHWRLRLRYHPATTPLQAYSRWLTMPWNGWGEQDFRATSSPLTADFTATPLTGTVPLTVTFTDQSTPTGIITGTLWTYGDGATSTTSTVTHTHTYTLPGVYTVTLAVSDGAVTDTLTRTEYITANVAYTTTTRVIIHAYDDLYRLTDADYSTGEQFQYAYDAVGNRTVDTRTFVSHLSSVWELLARNVSIQVLPAAPVNPYNHKEVSYEQLIRLPRTTARPRRRPRANVPVEDAVLPELSLPVSSSVDCNGDGARRLNFVSPGEPAGACGPVALSSQPLLRC